MYDKTNEDISSFVSDLLNYDFYVVTEVVALHFNKSRAGVMIGELHQPMYGDIIITMQNGVRIPPPPSPKKILKISTWGEAPNPKIEELEKVEEKKYY